MTGAHIKAACIQITSGPDIADNLKQAEGFIRAAAAAGAQLIVTPENTDYILAKPEKKLASAHTLDTHPGPRFFADLAKELCIDLLIGSMGIKDKAGDTHMANRSFLFNAAGETGATYDKIHLFDVDLEGGESYRESAYFKPGGSAVLADIQGAKLGMSICYDLRFAYLYREYAQAGADILSIPAAFTVPTGRAHWHVLQRARAIETGCFVLAPAQAGEHDGGRKTYGHSLIISPWGDVLAELEEGPGFIMADLNLDDVKKARRAIPALRHDRSFDLISA